MKTLIVRITEDISDTPISQCEYMEYKEQVPDNLDDKTYSWIAYGILFYLDWSAEYTRSEWEIV